MSRGSMKDLFGDTLYEPPSSKPPPPQPEWQRRKQDGMALASAGDPAWLDAGTTMIGRLPTGWTGTPEDIKQWFESCGMCQPKSHQQWGPLFSRCLKRRVLIKTGEQRPCRLPNSHGRGSGQPVYRRP